MGKLQNANYIINTWNTTRDVLSQTHTHTTTNNLSVKLLTACWDTTRLCPYQKSRAFLFFSFVSFLFFSFNHKLSYSFCHFCRKFRFLCFLHFLYDCVVKLFYVVFCNIWCPLVGNSSSCPTSSGSKWMNQTKFRNISVARDFF